MVLLGLRSGAPRALVLLVSFVHAPVSELVQALALPGRSGVLLDLAADWVGCAIGWWVATWGRLGR